MLQCGLCCSVLLCVEVCCGVLLCVVLLCVAVWFVLQCVEVCCVLQCVVDKELPWRQLWYLLFVSIELQSVERECSFTGE